MFLESIDISIDSNIGILIGIAISIITAGICSRFSFAVRKKILLILSIFFVGSEIGKQILLYQWNNQSYIWWYFPFQLCSMLLYLLPVALFLENTPHLLLRRALYTFLADFSTLAGIFVFADTSGMHYELTILTIHSYLWHFLMIFTGILLELSPEFSSSSAFSESGKPSDFDEPSDYSQTSAKQLPKKESPLNSPPFNTCKKSRLNSPSIDSGRKKSFDSPFIDACIIFLSCAGIALIINALFHQYGSINMFYISPWEPVTQAVFRDIAQKIGDTACHILYLLSIMFGAGIVHIFFKILRNDFTFRKKRLSS